jgi:hypothetical protein
MFFGIVQVRRRRHVLWSSYQERLAEAQSRRAGGGSPTSSTASSKSSPAPPQQQYQSQPQPQQQRQMASSNKPPSPYTSATSSDEPTASKPAWQSTAPAAKTARDMTDFKNKVPFSAEIYETIKGSIEVLNTRIQGQEPLTREEAEWLILAVDEIVADAHKYGPPPRPVNTEKK